MKNKKKLLHAVFLLCLLSLIIGVFLSCSGNRVSGKKSALNSENAPVKKQYVCSMHPKVVQNMPGDCPICGMTLIEKVIDKNPADTMLNNVVLPVNESVLSSISTVNPVRRDLPLKIEASGIINFDARKIRIVSARFGGLIEKSYVKSIFQRIHKGQKIYDIFCPNIYTDHWNYVKLIQTYQNQDNLTVEAREWFKYIGLTKDQLDALKKTIKPNYHLSVYSDMDGYAVPVDFDTEKYFSQGNAETNNQTVNTGVGLYDGMTIETGTSLFKVVDVHTLRADIQVKTNEIGLLRKGQKVILRTEATSGKQIESTVHQIEPLNGGVFQLVKVYFSDKEGSFIPGRHIQAEIQSGKRNSFWLPETTVVNMGEHTSVFVKHNDQFLATVIRTGLHQADKIEILSGVDTYSKVALNASLLIDSDGLIK